MMPLLVFDFVMVIRKRVEQSTQCLCNMPKLGVGNLYCYLSVKKVPDKMRINTESIIIRKQNMETTFPEPCTVLIGWYWKFVFQVECSPGSFWVCSEQRSLWRFQIYNYEFCIVPWNKIRLSVSIMYVSLNPFRSMINLELKKQEELKNKPYVLRIVSENVNRFMWLKKMNVHWASLNCDPTFSKNAT